MIDPHAIRADFPILNETIYGKPLIYLDNAATTHKPSAVLDTVCDFYTRYNSNIHRGAHCLSTQASELYESARQKVQHFINARFPEEVVFTRNTTEAINLVSICFGLRWIGEGDEIIISEMEHHSNIVPWQVLCKQKKAVLKVIPFDDNGKLQVHCLDELITEKTRLIAVTYVSNVLGTINPVKEIVSTANRFGVAVLVDGAQAVGHLAVDVEDIGCDFFVFSGHKLYAETGIGVLYGKEKWLNQMPPFQSGGGMISSVSLYNTSFAEIPYKFEAGTPNIAGAISLMAAVEYVETVGLDAIRLYEGVLRRYAEKKLSEIGGLRMYGSSDLKNAIVTFCIDGVDSYDAATVLDKFGIAVRSGYFCAEPALKHYNCNGAIRVSFALYNTKEEIDLLADGIRKVIAMIK